MTTTQLADWGQAIEYTLQTAQYDAAVLLCRSVLRYLPQHLPTYERLVRLAWLEKHWIEGEDWGRRLLRALPGNSVSWRAVARSMEQLGRRAESNLIWQRAFEVDPYEPEIRAGLARTSMDNPDALTLNLACLGALYLRGRRWRAAEKVFRTLVDADGRRIDFQTALLVALWQARNQEDAYRLARHLSRRHPQLLMAWVVLDAIGDENDSALAQSPIQSMDPNRELVNQWLGIQYLGKPRALSVDEDEAALLAFVVEQYEEVV